MYKVLSNNIASSAKAHCNLLRCIWLALNNETCCFNKLKASIYVFSLRKIYLFYWQWLSMHIKHTQQTTWNLKQLARYSLRPTKLICIVTSLAVLHATILVLRTALNAPQTTHAGPPIRSYTSQVELERVEQHHGTRQSRIRLFDALEDCSADCSADSLEGIYKILKKIIRHILCNHFIR